ncbi:MAG TPA: toll/interleukin-1 receptor domain-containing protein [Streptosporangiaceae bacterium]
MDRVFISYSSADRAEAFGLLKILEDSGADAWMDYFDIKPASVLESELTTNLDTASVACLLLSPTSVASRWVGFEVKHALARREAGLRIVPLILRPCRIPAELEELVAVDVSDGFDDEAVRLRVIRAVTGAGQADDGVLLKAGQRAAWAKRELDTDTRTRLPQLAGLLDRVRDKAVTSIQIQVDQHSFPTDPGLVVELRLELNPLWTGPMRFYFARYREGSTWPAELAFGEPSYEDFALGRRPRIDGKFRWFNRVEEPVASIDGTDDHSMLASFSMDFDGSEFLPASSGPVMPQRFEIPSLRKLADDGSRFVLTTHADGTAEEWADPELSTVDITVLASFRDDQPHWVQLFSSRHSRDARNVLATSAIAAITNPIEREVLAHLYTGHEQRPDSGERNEALIRAVLDEQPVPDADARLAAQLAVSRATFLAFRHNDRDAVRLYYGAAQLLEPIVMTGYPGYSDGVLLVRACNGLLGCYVKGKLYADALTVCDPVARVPMRLAQLYPDEPEYRRLTARGLLTCADVYLANGKKKNAVQMLTDSVEIWRGLAHQMPTPQRVNDARQGYLTALDLAARWKVAADLPVARWQDELDPDRRIASAVAARDQRQQTGPVWMLPSEPSGWPTVSYESPALRYQIRVPQRWSADPAVTATSRELQHVFAGSAPASLLSVRFMDKAVPGHDMRLWVETTKLMTGFPVLGVTSDGKPPELLEWQYEGEYGPLAAKRGLDELHCWSGAARIGNVTTPLRRLYIAAFRKQTFGWLIALLIETAVQPGMPEKLVETNDHVRAGATFGHIQLG